MNFVAAYKACQEGKKVFRLAHPKEIFSLKGIDFEAMPIMKADAWVLENDWYILREKKLIDRQDIEIAWHKHVSDTCDDLLDSFCKEIGL